MFEVISRWNSSRPDLLNSEFINKISLRGYKHDLVGLTGEFVLKLKDENNPLNKLSVGDIASMICPTRRDLYLSKGINKIKVRDKKTWGRSVGKFVEEYYYNLFPKESVGHKEKYSFIRRKADDISNSFFKSKNETINKLIKLEEEGSKREGDTIWLKNMMKQNGRTEFTIKLLNRRLRKHFDISMSDIIIEKEINPKTEIIGINSPTKPDFVIPKHKIIGDIKTGEKFEAYYPLTCAGYALAYENEFQTDINWGVIYFVPTHTTTKYYRVMTYPQIHFFPIDEYLRSWFLEIRDEAYNTITQKTAPKFPESKIHCLFCKYKDFCISDGLKIE